MLTRTAVPHVSGWSRVRMSSLAGLLFFAAAASVWTPRTARAQADQAIHIERVLQTEDDWQIYITYYPVASKQENVTKNAPVVVLLHGDKENRLIWEGEKGLARSLQREGFAVITVDLRKHGQSTNTARSAGTVPQAERTPKGPTCSAADYSNMVEQDLPAVKKFIYEQNQLKHLNMNKMGIVAAETSAAVAVCFAGDDWSKAPYDNAPTDEGKTPRGQDVRALVLLSPLKRPVGSPFRRPWRGSQSRLEHRLSHALRKAQ